MRKKLSEDYIKEFSGMIIGIIEVYDNGDRVAIDYPSRFVLGEYIKQYDHTIEWPSRRVIARGDVTSSFIYNKKKK